MVATLGMSVQHKVFIPSWFVVREKVFEQVPSITADFGLVRVEGRNLLHQNRLCFSLPAGRQVCYFLLQKQKKVEAE